MIFLTGWVLTGPAAAAEGQAAHPPFRPGPDVTVVYRVTTPARPDHAGKLRISYADHAQRVRIDEFSSLLAKNPDGALIFDQVAHQVLTLVPGRHGYLARDTGQLANPGLFLGPAMSFTRVGRRTLVGADCTDWKVTSGGFEGSACVTSDGVVLQAVRTAPHPEIIEALSVQRGPVPPGTFRAPADYRQIDRFGHPVR